MPDRHLATSTQDRLAASTWLKVHHAVADWLPDALERQLLVDRAEWPDVEQIAIAYYAGSEPWQVGAAWDRQGRPYYVIRRLGVPLIVFAHRHCWVAESVTDALNAVESAVAVVDRAC